MTSANPFYGSILLSGGANNSTTSAVTPSDPGSLYTNYTSVCDAGTSLSTTCTVSAGVLLGDGASVSGSGNLVIANGGSLMTHKNLSTISIAMNGNVTVQSGGLIKGIITNLSAANVTIQSGGVIKADGLGYLASWATSDSNIYYSSTASGKNSNTTIGTGGGAHGGFGGNGLNYQGHGSGYMGAETVYGSNTAPITYGAAGGSGVAAGVAYAYGGAGGGAIKITVASGGTLTVDGTLSANGLSGAGGNGASQPQGAGGAGGSLNLIADTVAGSGTISAAGGSTAGASGTLYAGGGGGGRISLSSTNKFGGTISVAGGAGAGTGATAGYPGYAYFTNASNYCSSGSLSSGTCTVSGSWRFNSGDTLSGASLTIASGGSIMTHPTDLMNLSLTGDLTVSTGGNIYANLQSVTAVNVTVAASGTISANGLGYQGAYGAVNGAGPNAGNGGLISVGATVGSGGGGHGGAGGKGANGSGANGIGGTANDSTTNPALLGSAGGGINVAGHVGTGGDGGGLIKMTLSGELAVAGTISANGSPGQQTAGNAGPGGGAGGGIKVTAATISGAGSVVANGAAGVNGTNGGGGGGGGIIYMSATSFTFSGSKAANGGAGGTGGGTAGTAGSAGVVTP